MKELVHILAEIFTVVSFVFTVLALLNASFVAVVIDVMLTSLGVVVCVITDHPHNGSWYSERND